MNHFVDVNKMVRIGSGSEHQINKKKERMKNFTRSFLKSAYCKSIYELPTALMAAMLKYEKKTQPKWMNLGSGASI